MILVCPTGADLIIVPVDNLVGIRPAEVDLIVRWRVKSPQSEVATVVSCFPYCHQLGSLPPQLRSWSSFAVVLAAGMHGCAKS